jgi:endonuclease/exonuclease/phosphatase (EEP) superfamily protein YafD
LVLLLPLLVIISFFHEKRIMSIYFLLVFLGGGYLYWILQPFKADVVDETKVTHLKHVQFNLNFRNQRIEDVKTFLKENSVDIVTLQEVTFSHKEALEKMKTEGLSVEFSKDYPYVGRKKGAYPYQQYCNFQSVGGVAILSKHPINIENSICMEGQGLLSTEILINDKPLNVASVHLYWPFPYGQTEQVKTISQVFEHISTPLLIAGDFNAVAWSHTLSQIEKASHTKVVNGLRWSITLEKQLPLIPVMQLSIDHVLVSSELQVDNIYVGEDLGSDHLPVLSEFRF